MRSGIAIGATMEKQIVIYPSEYDAENDQLIEGSTICVMRPTPEGLAACKSVYDFAEKHVPELRPFIQVSDEDLPEDATFEEAWTADFSDPTGVGLGPAMYALRALKEKEGFSTE